MGGLASTALAVVALSVICSTSASRAEGREAVKPYARAAFIVTLVIWGAVILSAWL